MLKDESVQPAADVVFIAEAKPCNTETFKKKMLRTFVTSLTADFKRILIDDVQFALMTFGGINEFANPESVTTNGQVFTSADNIYSYFDHIQPNNESTSDVLTAITKASKMIFRPGAIKIFILSLCGDCEMDLLKVGLKCFFSY